jgi:calcium-dependent protein kinase
MMMQQYGTPYYMAPEMVKGCYDEKVDVWSAGVILYILLTGMPPFDGEDEEQILNKIVNFKTFTFSERAWKQRSLGCMDLVKQLCVQDYKSRISAEQAMAHPWIMSNAAYRVKEADIQKALRCFQHFKTVGMLQKAVLNYIVTEIFTQRDKDKFLKIYYEINRRCNGLLTRDELLRAYWDNGFASLT